MLVSSGTETRKLTYGFCKLFVSSRIAGKRFLKSPGKITVGYLEEIILLEGVCITCIGNNYNTRIGEAEHILTQHAVEEEAVMGTVSPYLKSVVIFTECLWMGRFDSVSFPDPGFLLHTYFIDSYRRHIYPYDAD